MDNKDLKEQLKKEYMDSMAKLAYTANMLEREKTVKVSLDGIYEKKPLLTKEDIKLLNEKLLVIKGDRIEETKKCDYILSMSISKDGEVRIIDFKENKGE